MARIPRANHATSPQYIYERKEFTCNTMRGRWIKPYESDSGDLSIEEGAIFASHHNAGPMYVVYSYATPIAWWTEMYGWHVAKQKFSVTTSKHQSRLYLIK